MRKPKTTNIWPDTELVGLLEGIGIVEIIRGGEQFRLSPKFKISLVFNIPFILNDFADLMINRNSLPKTKKHTLYLLSLYIIGWWRGITNQEEEIPENELDMMAKVLATMMGGLGIAPK